jgi:hypothetical protein
MAREAGLSNYLDGMPAEYVARLLASDAKTDIIERDTSVLHKPTITPATAGFGSGNAPVTKAFGTVLGLHYDQPTDVAYRIVKIPHNLVVAGNIAAVEPSASFHIHWTKSNDLAQSGATVRWRMSYTVFDGKTDDVSVAPTVIDWDDTYDDGGTTSHIVHRTANIDAIGLVPDYYIGMQLEYVTANTTLVDPVCISADMLWRGWINTNSETFDP